jgi:hypothetical protein
VLCEILARRVDLPHAFCQGFYVLRLVQGSCVVRCQRDSKTAQKGVFAVALSLFPQLAEHSETHIKRIRCL